MCLGWFFAQDVVAVLKPPLCSGIMGVNWVSCSLKGKVPGCPMPMGDEGKGQKFGIKIPNGSFEWYRGKKIKLAFDFHNILLWRTSEQDEKALTLKQFSFSIVNLLC